jgi:hypothetical protein
MARPRVLPIGRVFVNAPFDYLAIGGGLSLLTVGALAWTGRLVAPDTLLAGAVVILIFNGAHFAASTVRLYTKPDAFRLWPFLTLVFPLVALAVLTAGVLWPAQIGTHIVALYLTWSPFHYAAQAFGLACMYHYRSGGTLDPVERRLIYWTCMLPFLVAFLTGAETGLRWFVPDSWLFTHPSVGRALAQVAMALQILTFAAPFAVAARLVLRRRQGLPLISWLIIVTNGIWWVIFPYVGAFLWATVFHGIQYLAIVTIFHVKDQTAQVDDRRSPLFHTVWFYGVCLAGGYLIFQVWPYAFLLAGFGLAESMLMCTAVINLHHFVVDRYIWRLRRDPNYEIVVSATGGGARA